MPNVLQAANASPQDARVSPVTAIPGYSNSASNTYLYMKNSVLQKFAITHFSQKDYRQDIDGLRAVAVLSVIGYHLFPDWINGGFIGVDIFFVISGFLISTIIFKDLSTNKFSLVSFYGKRIRRIFPALLTVLATCFLVGWFTLFVDEYKQLAKHIVGGAGFVSNFVLWRESGYFDNASSTKPLLHLWSLSIEEQFYIFWPAIILLSARLKISQFPILFGIIFTSFFYNVYTISQDEIGTFYSPFTRLWELMCGGLLAKYMVQNEKTLKNITISQRNWLSLCGVLLLGVGFLSITKRSLFPGYLALLPVGGALLVILAGAKAWINRTILSHRLFVWLGLISYPLYLWHWPLLCFLRLEGEPTRVLRFGVFILSIALSFLTYRLIEMPIRNSMNRQRKTLILSALLFTTIIIGFLISNHGFSGYGIRTKENSDFLNYFENKSPNWQYFNKINQREAYREDCNFGNTREMTSTEQSSRHIDKTNSSCTTKVVGKKHVLLWGDSHAQMLYFGINANLPTNWQILTTASSGCLPVFTGFLDSNSNYCSKANLTASKIVISGEIDVVILAQAPPFEINKLKEFNSTLKMHGVKKVIFMGQVPQWHRSLPYQLARNNIYNVYSPRTNIGLLGSIKVRDSILKSSVENTGLVYLSLYDLFCNDNGCLTRVGSDSMDDIVSWDNAHLTPKASNFVAKTILVNKITGL